MTPGGSNDVRDRRCVGGGRDLFRRRPRRGAPRMPWCGCLREVPARIRLRAGRFGYTGCAYHLQNMDSLSSRACWRRCTSSPTSAARQAGVRRTTSPKDSALLQSDPLVSGSNPSEVTHGRPSRDGSHAVPTLLWCMGACMGPTMHPMWPRSQPGRHGPALCGDED